MTNGFDLGNKLDLWIFKVKCDLDLWPYAWRWLWIFMNKFRNSCISEWEGRLTFNKGGRSRSFMTMTMTIWWPRSGVKIYHIVTGVSWDVGMPLTCLFLMENAFFYFKFHWNVFPRVQLTINLHWFRSLFHRQQATVWTNDGQVYWHSYMLLGLNESIHWYSGHSYVKPIFQSYNDFVNIWWSLISNGRVQIFLWYLINFVGILGFHLTAITIYDWWLLHPGTQGPMIIWIIPLKFISNWNITKFHLPLSSILVVYKSLRH